MSPADRGIGDQLAVCVVMYSPTATSLQVSFTASR